MPSFSDGGIEPDREELQRMSQTPSERRHIFFYGDVQGVGFRYHALRNARSFGLTGWVENLPDGSVEMEIQGPAELIDYAVQNIGRGSWIRIRAMEAQRIPLVEDERSFRVRGY